jgi:hypothetical protein
MTINPMTVADLIKFLQTQPQDLQVAFLQYSEQCLLEQKDIKVVEASVARPDGWIKDARPNQPTQKYLMFPGN